MMNKDDTYNGWHSYATWRVNLEIFDGMELEEPWTWETCRDYVEDILTNESDGINTLVSSYAFAFINDVAWGEIAEHLNEQLKGE